MKAIKGITETCNKWLLMTLVVLAAAFLVTSFAQADEQQSYTDLQNRLATAESEIYSLKNPSAELDKKRAEHIKRLVKETLKDADSRAYLFTAAEESPVTANLHGFAIFRWQYNGGGDVGNSHGFNLPYERLEVSGKVYDWTYKVSGEYSDYNSGSFDLVDAYASGNLFDTLDMRVGQFVTSFYKGYTDSPLDQVVGEYSLVATTFGQGRSQGLEFSKNWDSFRLAASYNDGFNTMNGASLGGPTDYGVSFRGDLDLGAGFGVGAAYAYQSAAIDYSTYTVDMSYSRGNWDAGISWVASEANGDWADNYGVVGTVGYQCMKNLQGFVQYEYGQSGVGNGNLSLGTIGVNYAFSPNVRWTTSLGYSFDNIAGWNTYRSGWNASSEDGEYLVNSQISVSF
tara:strand:+ start:200 stop:1393 length:1194 start_codon:yes stop_codon:yes gene_type:complete